MTYAFLAENHRRRTSMTLPIWRHDCCSFNWSAARHCDRCGTAAITTVNNLTIAEAMAERSLPPLRLSYPRPQTVADISGTRPTVAATAPATVSPPAVKATMPETGKRRDPEEMERLFLSILWWLAGVVSLTLAAGGIVEFGDGNHVKSVMLFVGASSAPAGILCAALDGSLHRLATRWLRRSVTTPVTPAA